MDNRIFEHYLSRFESKDRPPRLAGKRGIGMEAKFCLTDSGGEAVSVKQLEALFHALSDGDWRMMIDGNLGIPTGVCRESPTCPAVVTTGTGHCKIELSVPYDESIEGLRFNLESMAGEVKESAETQDIHLLCLGVHPVTEPHPDLVQRKSRHIFWDKVFKSGLVHLFALSADCQVHVDVEPGEVHTAVNVLQGFSGPQIALTANATVWRNGIDGDHLDVREAFWDWWLPEEGRAGMAPAPFASLEDYVDRLTSLRPVFVERDGVGLGIYQYRDFKEYYSAGPTAEGITPEGHKVPMSPEERDIDLHDTFNWYTARLSRYCTLENRANCQQPPEDIMSIPALTLGLMEALDEAWLFLAEYDWGVLRDCRREAMMEGPRARAGGFDIREMCRAMLEIAREGLAKRSRGEEEFLAPLWSRLEDGTCPALETRELYQSGGIDALLERYSI
jgi:gamma-glutamylcysteine synthetase